MSTLDELLQSAQRHVIYDESADVPSEVFDLLSALVATVKTGTLPTPARGFTTAGRVAALEAARKHVDALATNSRGYQDGVTLVDKVAAVERTARFILGEEDSE